MHAFAGSSTGPYLLSLIAFSVLVPAVLIVARYRYLRTDNPIESILSREGGSLLTNLIFALATAIVWVTTMSPLFADLFLGEKTTVTPELFNRLMAPVGLGIVFLLGVCPYLKWRATGISEIAKRLLPSTATAIVAALLAIAFGAVRSDISGFSAYVPVISIALVGFAAAGAIQRIASISTRAVEGKRLSLNARQRLGGQIAHLAMAMMFAGFTGAAFTVEKTESLAPAQSIKIGDLSAKLVHIRQDSDFERDALFADLDVRKDGNPIGVLSPARFNYRSHPGRPTSEVVIKTTVFEDVFLILGQSDPMSGRAIIRMVINPMVFWVWLGGALLLIGTAIAAPGKGWIEALLANFKEPGFRSTLGACFVVVSASVIAGFYANLATAVIIVEGLFIAAVVWLFASCVDGLFKKEKAS